MSKKTGEKVIDMKNKSITITVLALISVLLLTTAPCALVYEEDFFYDSNGNLIQGGGKCYEYTDANRLKKVTDCLGDTIAEYWYDHTGRRVKKVEDAVITYYPFPDYEERHYPDGRVEKTIYHYANGELVARTEIDHEGKEKKYFYHSDHLGSTNVVTDENGEEVEKTEYYPFGKIREGGTKSKHLFTGQEFDPETEFYYYKARYYAPRMMSFAQPDPIVQDMYDPQSLNRYSYVKNNPVKYVDPSGNYALTTGIDIASITLSINDVVNDPGNPWNWAALGADVVTTAFPIVAGGGIAVRAASKSDDVVDVGKIVASSSDEVVQYGDEAIEAAGEGLSYLNNLINAGNKADDVADLAKTADTAKDISQTTFRRNLARHILPPGPGYEAHHIIPKNPQIRHLFTKRGFTDEFVSSVDNAMWVPGGHGKTWRQYQDKIVEYITENPSATTEQIVEFAKKTTREMYGG